ncbi:MAG: ATP-binding protein [Candidatus Ranarchaeia archaeon]
MKYDHLFPKVDLPACTGCGTCEAVCPAGVFEIENEKANVARPEDCTECNECVDSCPEQCIELVEN